MYGFFLFSLFFWFFLLLLRCSLFGGKGVVFGYLQPSAARLVQGPTSLTQSMSQLEGASVCQAMKRIRAHARTRTRTRTHTENGTKLIIQTKQKKEVGRGNIEG